MFWTERSNQYRLEHFLAHSNHVPVALCRIMLQCFSTVFSAPKYSCVLPKIIANRKVELQQSKAYTECSEALVLVNSRTMFQNQVYSQIYSFQYLNTANMYISCCAYLVQRNARRIRSCSDWWEARSRRSCLLADLCWTIYRGQLEQGSFRCPARCI